VETSGDRCFAISASLWSALVFVVSGCSLPLQDEASQIMNRCTSSSDCGADAACVADDGGLSSCVSTKADLSGLLVEVRPSAAGLGSSTQGQVQSGAGYLLRPEDAGLRVTGSDLGGVLSWNADLPPLVEISDGTVRVLAKGDGCRLAAGDTIAAEVFFYRSVEQAGLPVAEYHAITSIVDGEDRFSVSLPAGEYDVYVKPQGDPSLCTGVASETLELPPYFIRQLPIGAGNVHLNISLPERRQLFGQVTTALDISDWSIALTDRIAGRLISTESTLVHDDLVQIPSYQIEYHPTAGPGPYEPPWVRVRAPSPELSPQVLWKLEEVDLDGDSECNLTMGALTKPVDVQAQVLSTDERDGVPSSVTLVGNFENVEASVRFQFERTVQTDEDGRFSTQLFPASLDEPGRYDVFARPLSDATPEAIGMAGDWEINAGAPCFCGHAVVLPPRALVSALVQTRSGEPVIAAVSASQSAANEDKIAPRAIDTDIVGGSLSLPLDPGTFDLSIKPEAASGFPWLVTSQLQIQTGQAATQLGTLEVPYPVVLRGQVLDASGQAVPHAPITAYLPVTGAEESSSSVVQIAATVSDVDGVFTLLLPPSLAH
jgi:hypothetical protein